MPNGWFSPSMKISRCFGDAVAIGVAQQGDAVGADAERGGTSHRRLHRIAEHVPDRSGDLVRLGNEDVAIGQHLDPARMLQAGRKRIDLESRRRHVGICPSLQPLADGIFSVGSAPCGFASGNHRGAAPGRLGRCALQPAPQQRGAADQRDDAREKCRKSSCHSPVDRAHPIRRRGAFNPYRHWWRPHCNSSSSAKAEDPVRAASQFDH